MKGKIHKVLILSLALCAVLVFLSFGAEPVAAWVDNDGWFRDPGRRTTDSTTFVNLFTVYIPYLPPEYGSGEANRIRFNFNLAVVEGGGTAYAQIYRNYGSLGGPGSGNETETELGWGADGVHADGTNSSTNRYGWDWENEFMTFSIFVKVTEGSVAGIQYINIYRWGDSSMVFENDFENGDSADGGDGTEGDPFIIEGKYIVNDAYDDNGIEVKHANDSYWIIRNNNIVVSDYGIYVENASNGVIQGNIIDNCNMGIYLKDCDNVTVFGNRLINSVDTGVYLEGCTDVTVYYNYFENSGTRNAYDNATNIWDAGGHGNYWDDWQPPTYPEIGDTGIISLPRAIFGGFGVDSYPLVIAAGSYGSVVSITPGTQNGTVGDTVEFTVAVQNLSTSKVIYDLDVSDVEGWTTSLQSTITVWPYSTTSATLSVVVASGVAVGSSNTVTVTATDQTNSANLALSTCIVTVTITPDVGISAWSAALASGLGISEDSAGILMSTMVLLMIVFPLAYIGCPMEGMTIILIILIGLTTAFGWLPAWIAILVGIGFSLILARQLSAW